MSRSVSICVCVIALILSSACVGDAVEVLLGGSSEKTGTSEAGAKGQQDKKIVRDVQPPKSDSFWYMLSGEQVRVQLSKKWIVLLDDRGLMAGRQQDGVVMEVWVAKKTQSDASTFLKEQLEKYLSQIHYFRAPHVIQIGDEDVVIARNKEYLKISGYDGFQATGRARDHRSLDPVVWSAGFVDHGNGEALIALAHGPEKKLRLLQHEIDDVMASTEWLAQK